MPKITQIRIGKHNTGIVGLDSILTETAGQGMDMQEMMAVIEKAGVEAQLEHVRDFREISSYGVMGSPALVINGKVKAVGSIPSRAKLLTILQEAILQNTGGQVSSKKP